MKKKSRHGRRLTQDEKIAIASATDADISALARRFGVSRGTIYKYRKNGAEVGDRTSVKDPSVLIRIPLRVIMTQLLQGGLQD